ncbi:MAG: 3-dehydrosphinganine reductase [Claussenomyces sp. TS43310]|nr:MAG: 3-dehydrosphinganine reductase [Claussenomyces sp. TS43310]
MGKNVAKMLAEKGANVIIAARNVGKLESALESIKSCARDPSRQRFHYISADVSRAGEASRILAETIAFNHGIAPDIVWCIAGSANPRLFLDSTPEMQRQQMDINYWSCADMAHAVLGEWLAPDSPTQGEPRHLVFTSSVVAFYTIAGYAPYSPPKAAIRSLADALAQEVQLYTPSVKIHTVFPGTIKTAGLEEEERTKPEITKILEKDDPVQSPEAVAAQSIAGLERGEHLVTVNWLGSLMRACTWGGSTRNNWLLDTLFMWAASLVWMFVYFDLNGKVKAYGKSHGHPSTYTKRA